MKLDFTNDKMIRVKWQTKYVVTLLLIFTIWFAGIDCWHF